MKLHYVYLNGKSICFESAVQLMDDELRENIHLDLAPCTDQDFIDEYAKRHYEKYGEIFEIN